MKTHLADSSVPLKEGSELTAICGAVIKDAAFVFMWDDLTVNVRAFSGVTWVKGLCSQCKKIQVKQRYIYGIASGEEMKQRRAGEEA